MEAFGRILMSHEFHGKWITNEYFANVKPRDLFYQHPYKMNILSSHHDPHTNCHILYRKKFTLKDVKKAEMFISADDFYKLYINGEYVDMGPTPSYKWAYRYHKLNVKQYLRKGENTIAVHTYYQGLVNRYWVSGDLNHGLILDLVVDGKTVVKSDESFRIREHHGYKATGFYGYETCFREDYDARAKETGFQKPDFDDSAWENAHVKKYANYKMVSQETKIPVLETVTPVSLTQNGNVLQLDFGMIYPGYLNLVVKGRRNSVVTLKSAQELDAEGRAMYVLRTSKVEYLEHWTLSGKEDVLDLYDYKPMRYVDIELPEGAKVLHASFTVRHYPFEEHTKLRQDLLDACKTDKEREDLKRVYKLCVDTLHYGPQETIHDCLDRERGTYLADVGMAAATHVALTGDPSLLRGIINDAKDSMRICDSLGAGTCCSLVHLTAEYPLIFLRTIWISYCVTKDKKALAKDYEFVKEVLDNTRRDYEMNGLYRETEKWSVVEWPKEYRDGYDVELSQKDIEKKTHIVLNMTYYKAICTANIIANELGKEPYRDEKEVGDAIIREMYDKKKHLFKDHPEATHTSYIGNLYPMAYGLIPDEKFEKKMDREIRKKKVSAVNEFGPIPILEYYCKKGDVDAVKTMLLDKNAWLQMLREGATATFEAWGKELKWNTSLYHNSLAVAALFMCDRDWNELFR